MGTDPEGEVLRRLSAADFNTGFTDGVTVRRVDIDGEWPDGSLLVHFSHSDHPGQTFVARQAMAELASDDDMPRLEDLQRQLVMRLDRLERGYWTYPQGATGETIAGCPVIDLDAL